MHSVTWRSVTRACAPVNRDTVSALLLVWDGAELVADDTGSLAGRLGSPGTRRARPAPAPAT